MSEIGFDLKVGFECEVIFRNWNFIFKTGFKLKPDINFKIDFKVNNRLKNLVMDITDFIKTKSFL